MKDTNNLLKQLADGQLRNEALLKEISEYLLELLAIAEVIANDELQEEEEPKTYLNGERYE